MFTHLRVKYNFIKSKVNVNKKRKRKTAVTHISALELIRALNEFFPKEKIYLHVGLSVLKCFTDHPYELLREALLLNRTVIVPTFTPSFRKSGVYHKQFSKPEIGAFSVQFLDDFGNRTDDCIFSHASNKAIDLEEVDYYDTFGERGLFAYLASENVIICNIGLQQLVSSFYHYIERVENCPYHIVKNYKGVIYYNDSTFKNVTQICHTYNVQAAFNRNKVHKLLHKTRVIKETTFGSKVLVNYVRFKDFYEVIKGKIRHDPYFLID